MNDAASKPPDGHLRLIMDTMNDIIRHDDYIYLLGRSLVARDTDGVFPVPGALGRIAVSVAFHSP